METKKEVVDFKIENEKKVEDTLAIYFEEASRRVRDFYVTGSLIYDIRTLVNRQGFSLLEVIITLYYLELYSDLNNTFPLDIESLGLPIADIPSLNASLSNDRFIRFLRFINRRVPFVVNQSQRTLNTRITKHITGSIFNSMEEDAILQQTISSASLPNVGAFVSKISGELNEGNIQDIIDSNLDQINTDSDSRVREGLALGSLILLNQKLDREAVADSAMELIDANFEGSSTRISMTETQIPTESFRFDEAAAIGAVTFGLLKQTKTWRTILDGRERPWHQEADGQTVGMDEPFIVKGEQLNVPGDTSLGAAPDNVINCRCEVTYFFSL